MIMMISDMILQLDDNMLMSLELLPSLITCIFNTEVNLMNLMALVYLMYLVSCLLLRCVCCFMCAAMYAVKLYNVNKCEYVRSGFWVVCSPPACVIPKLIFRTQLTRPSASGWYCPSVPGGSETPYHRVTYVDLYSHSNRLISMCFSSSETS